MALHLLGFLAHALPGTFDPTAQNGTFHAADFVPGGRKELLHGKLLKHQARRLAGAAV